MPIKIQHLQWLGGILAAAACLALGGLSLHTNLADHERFRRGGEQLARYHAVLTAANAVSAERGPANSAMGGAEQDRDALLAALAAKRAETDSMIASVEAAFAAETAAAEELRQLRSELHLRLGQGRAAVDAVVTRPRAERLGSDVAFAIEMMFTAADAAMALRDRLGRTVVSHTPQIAAHIVLNNAASRMREDAGRLGSYVVMQLTSDGGQRDHFQDRITEAQGRLQDLRRFVGGFAGALFRTSDIDGAVAQVDTVYFGHALPYAREVAARLPGSTPGADVFTRAYVPGMRPLEELRELIAARSQSTVDDLRGQASRLVLASLLLTLVVVLAIGAIGLVFRNGLFVPLIAARRQILAIAHGDLADPPRMARVSAEMRAMFEGLDVLRDQQRQRLRLEEEQRRLTDQLRHLSQTDVLTNILNRRALNAAAVETLATADGDARTVGVVLFDIDHFKAINDSRGHAAGDAVLTRIAAEVAQELGPDALFARYGGEEFIVLLPDTGLDEAMALADRLRNVLARVAVPGAPHFVVTGSFGIAVRAPGALQTWEQLVATADQRLYRAKRNGRNRVCGPDTLPLAPIPLRSACG